MTRGLVLGIVLMLAAGRIARAQPSSLPPGRDDDAMSNEARAHYDRGTALYRAGDYARAIDAFDAGQRVEVRPEFFFARGQAYRKLGDCAQAIAQFEAFLATRPPEEDAAETRKIIALCPVAPPLRSPPAPDRARYRDPAGGVLAGAGAIGLAAGTTFLILGERAARAAHAAASDGSLGDFEDLLHTTTRDRAIGAVCLIAGGALVVGAAVRYALVGRTARESRWAIAPSPRGDGIAASWDGRW